MSLLDAWVVFTGGAPTNDSVEAVQAALRGFPGSGSWSKELLEDARQGVIERYLGRRVTLLAKLRATGEPTPGLLSALGTVAAGIEEVEGALGRPLDAAGRAALEERLVRSPARVVATLRTSLKNALLDHARSASARHHVQVDELVKAQDPRLGAKYAPQAVLADEAIAQAERRWADGLTQTRFAAWRAEGKGDYAGKPELVCEDLRLMEQIAADPSRHRFPTPTYGRRCARLRAAMTDVVGPPDDAPGPAPWPVVRLRSEEALEVYADALVAEGRLRQRAEAAPVHSPGPRRHRAEE
jgi:hypothetical protein